MTKQNILFIMTDQQRRDAMGIYGNEIIQTPNMDRLGREGIVFENSFCTHPLCVPTRATLMLGRPLKHDGIHFKGAELIHPEDSYASILAEAGYDTAAIGKMHFTPQHRRPRPSFGFQHMELSEETRLWRQAKKAEDIDLDEYDRFLHEHNALGWDKPQEIGYNQIKPTVNPLPKELNVTQWCGDRTVAWLEQSERKEKPWLLVSSFVKPHVPYDFPRHLRDLYKAEDMPEPLAQMPSSWNFYDMWRKRNEFDLYSDYSAKLALAAYYANITFIDEQVGRILDSLEKNGQLDNTIIIFTSDHGDMMGDHGQWFKKLGFEGSIGVPMMLRMPDKNMSAKRVAAPVSHCDIYHTILEAAGIESPHNDLPGASLQGIASGEVERDFTVSFMHGMGFYLIDNNYKYIYYQNGTYEELFDRKNDPNELNNLIDKTELKNKYKVKLESWLKEYAESYGLNSKGKLEEKEPWKPADLPEAVNPFSRLPWESRVAPCLINLNSPGLSWYWHEGVKDIYERLPEKVKKRI